MMFGLSAHQQRSMTRERPATIAVTTPIRLVAPHCPLPATAPARIDRPSLHRIYPPNPHSSPPSRAPHIPRFPSLAAFGHRPSVRVASVVVGRHPKPVTEAATHHGG